MKMENVQFLFADLQVSLVAGSKTISPQSLAKSAGVLAKVGSVLNIPMLFSVVPENGGPPQLLPELVAFSTTGNTISRKLASPFMDEQTVRTLSAQNRKTLVIAGFTAEVVVLQAALDAIAAGYVVYYVVDAVGSRSERTEAAAFRQIELAGGQPCSVMSLSTRLAPDFFRAPGSDVFAALRVLRQP